MGHCVKAEGNRGNWTEKTRKEERRRRRRGRAKERKGKVDGPNERREPSAYQ